MSGRTQTSLKILTFFVSLNIQLKSWWSSFIVKHTNKLEVLVFCFDVV